MRWSTGFDLNTVRAFMGKALCKRNKNKLLRNFSVEPMAVHQSRLFKLAPSDYMYTCKRAYLIFNISDNENKIVFLCTVLFLITKCHIQTYKFIIN